MPPSVPLNHYPVFQKPTEQKQDLVLLFHALLFRRIACVEHSNFFKVNAPAKARHLMKGTKPRQA